MLKTQLHPAHHLWHRYWVQLLNVKMADRWTSLCFRRSYYAADWASFTFNGLLTWIQQHHVSTTLLSDWLLQSPPWSCRKTTNMEDSTAAEHDGKDKGSRKCIDRLHWGVIRSFIGLLIRYIVCSVIIVPLCVRACVLVGGSSARGGPGLVEPVGGRGGADLPVKLRLCLHQEPAGVLFHQVNLRLCCVSWAQVGPGQPGSARSLCGLDFSFSFIWLILFPHFCFWFVLVN